MGKSTRRRRRHRQIGGGSVVAVGHGGLWRLAPRPQADLSREARAGWRCSTGIRHGRDVSLTARHFGFSRPTVYRWLGRFERHRLETLEDRASPRAAAAADLDGRPSRRSGPPRRYPRWGKDKLGSCSGARAPACRSRCRRILSAGRLASCGSRRAADQRPAASWRRP